VKLILDTDIGTDVDDAVALALAINSPEIELIGVTTVFADVTARARHAMKMLQLAGRTDIPVAAGTSLPLLRERPTHWGGHEGKGVLGPEGDALRPIEQHAVDFIASSVLAEPGQVTLAAVGPLTNIALAIIREPRIIESVKELIVMGGATRTGGNALALPVAEWNIFCDPEAARVVIGSGIHMTMVTLDVTTQVVLNREHLARIRAAGTPLASCVADQLDTFWTDSLKSNGSHMHDPLAVSLLVDRTLVRTERMNVTVATGGEFPGQTIAQPAGSDGGIDVSVSVDSDRFIELLVGRLAANG